MRVLLFLSRFMVQWPQAKGLNIANPLAQILSVAMLFEYFNCKEEGA